MTTANPTGTLSYLLTDHLGSTTITATTAGEKSAEIEYRPWGESRISTGTTPTQYQYTGQRKSVSGLYYYNSRWYDPSLGRFIQPDTVILSVDEETNPNLISFMESTYSSSLTIDFHEYQFLKQLNTENVSGKRDQSVPSYVFSFDRYAYTFNNPVKYNDPSGHCIWDLCFLEGVGIVEIGLLVVASIATIEITTPGKPEAFAQSIDLYFSKKHDVQVGKNAADQAGLDREGQREVHDNNTKQGLSDQEYEEEAERLADMNQRSSDDKALSDALNNEELQEIFIEIEKQLIIKMLGYDPFISNAK